MRHPQFVLVVLAATLITAEAQASPAWQGIRPGSRVEVDIVFRNGVWVAEEIDVRANPSGGVEIVAPVTRRTSRELTLLGRPIVVTARTKWKEESGEALDPASIREGDWLEVTASLRSGRLEARRVKRLRKPRKRVEIEGEVLRLDRRSRRLVVAGLAIYLPDDTRVRGAPIVVPRAIDDDDARPEFLTAFNDQLLLGGRISGDVEPERNYDLNDGRDDDLVQSTWTTELQADFTAGPKWEAFVKAGARGQRVLVDDEGDEADRVEWRVPQAYVLWRPHRDVAVQIGRQDFDEPREWLYDENLDAVRIHAQRGATRSELSVSRRWNVDSKRLTDWTNYMVILRRSVAPRWDTEAYVIHRRHPNGQDPIWMGLRSRGRLKSGVRHWVELASLSGSLEGTERSAWAFDLGLRIRLERRTRLSVTAGWAVGSGGDDARGTFRQTLLQDNNDKFAGVSSTKYYGELLEPELSNLSVRTLALGLRPTRHSSVDVIYHGFAQRRAFARLENTNLGMRPRGREPDLGTEWDVVVAFEEIPRLDLEYVFARFRPGPAFDSSAGPATFHKLSIRYGF